MIIFLHRSDEPEVSSSTDAEAGKTYGYEGDFKVGDIVRVNKDIKIWSVKEYNKEGFSCEGYQGTVKELVLYGRKLKVRRHQTSATYIRVYIGRVLTSDAFSTLLSIHHNINFHTPHSAHPHPIPPHP